ncbi:MAG: ABC transporter substrate-binding protein [Candidatus Rokubacteria bacterium]|nr:ABC transporter substrate-binding protein [Candidatus Rokubacteria bacterium]
MRVQSLTRLRIVSTALLVAMGVGVLAGAASRPASAQPAGAPGAAPGVRGIKPAAMTPVKIAIGGGLKSAAYWDVMVAEAQGFLVQNRLQPEFIEVAGGPDTVQAVVAGSADFGGAATDSIVRGINKGAPIAMIAGGAYPALALVTAPAIDTYEKLRGKRIAVTSVTAGSTLLLVELLRAHGLGEKDVEFVLSGATPQRLAAVTSGAVQGTVLSPPEDLTAQKAGFRILGYVNEAARFVFISHMVSKPFAAKNRPAAVAYARAIRDANRFLLDPANKAASVAALRKYTKASPENADATYDTVIGKLKGFVKDATPTAKDLEGMLRVVERTDKISGLKTDTFIDTSFLRDAGQP